MAALDQEEDLARHAFQLRRVRPISQPTAELKTAGTGALPRARHPSTPTPPSIVARLKRTGRSSRPPCGLPNGRPRTTWPAGSTRSPVSASSCVRPSACRSRGCHGRAGRSRPAVRCPQQCNLGPISLARAHQFRQQRPQPLNYPVWLELVDGREAWRSERPPGGYDGNCRTCSDGTRRQCFRPVATCREFGCMRR